MGVDYHTVAVLEREIASLNKINISLTKAIEEKKKKISLYKAEKIERVPIALGVYPTLSSASNSIQALSGTFSGSINNISSTKSNNRFAINTLSNLEGITNNIKQTSSSLDGLNGGGPRQSAYYGVAKSKDDNDVLKLEEEVNRLNQQIENNNNTILSLQDSIQQIYDEAAEGSG